jgi:serine/threonine protein phosphatase 1
MRWIIGDIHGMLRPLEALIRAVQRADAQAQLLFVGDFINRGPDSRGVIDLILGLAGARCVRGNHDDVFDQVLNDQSFAGQAGEDHRRVVFQWFMQHGLDATFKSYGVTQSELTRALQAPNARAFDSLAAQVPARHREFIRNLPPLIEEDDLFIAHAKWDAALPTEAPPLGERLSAAHPSVRHTLLWGRYGTPEILAEKPWRRAGYFGHTPVDVYADRPDLVPIAGPRIVLLDTAAALSPRGRLTAFCHETQTFIQADVAGRIVI